jgi:hypothetical protein
VSVRRRGRIWGECDKESNVGFPRTIGQLVVVCQLDLGKRAAGILLAHASKQRAMFDLESRMGLYLLSYRGGSGTVRTASIVC